MSTAVRFAIELYNYFGFDFRTTEIERAVETKNTKLLETILRGRTIEKVNETDIFELKKRRFYTSFTIAEWLSPVIEIALIDCVRMEFAKDKFPKSYEILQMNDYRNTYRCIQTLTFTYADIFIEAWEEAYGSILTSGIELKKLKNEMYYLILQNSILKRKLAQYEKI